ncbi:hypothetical protein HN011_007471 [Eciton burchellii]|nr:hypothetical protein HN011_007471 [Eciton burchellii]
MKRHNAGQVDYAYAVKKLKKLHQTNNPDKDLLRESYDRRNIGDGNQGSTNRDNGTSDSGDNKENQVESPFLFDLLDNNDNFNMDNMDVDTAETTANLSKGGGIGSSGSRCYVVRVRCKVRPLGCGMNFLTASTASKYATSEFVAIGQKAIGLNISTTGLNAVTYSDAAKPMVPNQWTIVDINKYLEKFYNDNNTEALQVVLRHMNAYCHILLPDVSNTFYSTLPNAIVSYRHNSYNTAVTLTNPKGQVKLGTLRYNFRPNHEYENIMTTQSDYAYGQSVKNLDCFSIDDSTPTKDNIQPQIHVVHMRVHHVCSEPWTKASSIQDEDAAPRIADVILCTDGSVGRSLSGNIANFIEINLSNDAISSNRARLRGRTSRKSSVRYDRSRDKASKRYSFC